MAQVNTTQTSDTRLEGRDNVGREESAEERGRGRRDGEQEERKEVARGDKWREGERKM